MVSFFFFHLFHQYNFYFHFHCHSQFSHAIQLKQLSNKSKTSLAKRLKNRKKRTGEHKAVKELKLAAEKRSKVDEELKLADSERKIAAEKHRLADELAKIKKIYDIPNLNIAELNKTISNDIKENIKQYGFDAIFEATETIIQLYNTGDTLTPTYNPKQKILNIQSNIKTRGLEVFKSLIAKKYKVNI